MRMTRVLAAALVLTACGGEKPPLPRESTMPKIVGQSDVVVRGRTVVHGDHAIIQSGAVGPLRVGMWRRQAMSLVYAVGATQGAPGEDLIVVRGVGRDTVTLAFIDDTLRRVLVSRPGPHTADSIEVGTPLARLTALTGAHSTGSADATVVTLPAYCGVTFSTAAMAGSTPPKLPAANGPVVRTITIGACAGAPPAR